MENMGTLSSQLSMAKVGTPFSQLGYELSISSSERIESKLSYSYIELIIDVDEPFKRTFYEIECIKGTWSVRELKRQIASLYYERSGFLAKPGKLAELVIQKITRKLYRP